MAGAERLLLKLCRAIAAAHAGRRMRWCTHVDLSRRLPELTEEQLDAAIAVALDRGLIEAGGLPAHSVMLTEAGWRTIT